MKHISNNVKFGSHEFQSILLWISHLKLMYLDVDQLAVIVSIHLTLDQPFEDGDEVEAMSVVVGFQSILLWISHLKVDSTNPSFQF